MVEYISNWNWDFNFYEHCYMVRKIKWIPFCCYKGKWDLGVNT